MGPDATSRLEALSGQLLSRTTDVGQAAVVELLLERKADLNLAALSGDTPLAVAAQNGYAAVVQTLLGHGADSALALDAARKSGQADAVRLLTAIAVE